MKNLIALILMVVISFKMYAPNLGTEFSEPRKEPKTIIHFMVDMKSSETWHDSLNYKYGNAWRKVNRIGALGAFQFMPSTLRALGYRGTFDYFLKHEDCQVQYMVKLIEINKRIANKTSKRYKLNIADSIGRTVNGILITWSSVIGAGHLAGIGNVQRWLARKGNATDGHCSVKDYLNKFNNYDMSINMNTPEAYRLMHEGILALSRAEQQGIRVDVDFVKQKKAHLTRKISRLEEQFRSTNFFKHWEHSTKGKINIYSPIQLSVFLYKVKKLEPVKFTKSSTDENQMGSTDDEALTQLNIPELDILLECKKLKRLRDNNLDGFLREQVNGYIHPFFNLNLAITFRSSSDSPNFQNIPIRDEESMQTCRRSLYPRPGHQMLEADFKGVEVCVSACYNKDPKLITYVSDPSTDMHRDMAEQIFLIDKIDKSIESHKHLRQAAKNGFVFPEFYGSWYKNCASNLACTWGKLGKERWTKGQGCALNEGTLSDHLISHGIKSFDKFTDHLKIIEDDFWGNRFNVYAEWKDKWFERYIKRGYVDTYTGFRCQGVMDKKDTSNYPIQGSAFHCLLWSFIQVDRWLMENKMDTKLIGQIHDSMILDVNPSELAEVAAKIKEITCKELPKHWSWIIVPLDVDLECSPVDSPWAEKQKLKLS